MTWPWASFLVSLFHNENDLYYIAKTKIVSDSFIIIIILISWKMRKINFVTFCTQWLGILDTIQRSPSIENIPHRTFRFPPMSWGHPLLKLTSSFHFPHSWRVTMNFLVGSSRFDTKMPLQLSHRLVCIHRWVPTIRLK